MGLALFGRSKVALAAGLCMSLTACETQPTHEVLTVSDISPRQIEVGERVIVQGTGFPQASDIRRITLRLGGTIARPGMAACGHPVVFTLTDPPLDQRVIDPTTGAEREPVYASARMHTLRVEGGTRLEFVVTDAILRALTTCPGEHEPSAASHATLALAGARGGVSVRIETLQGTVLASSRAMRGPRLDLLAPFARGLDVEIAARAAADRTLDYMGLRLASVHPPEGGLQVERVTPGSPADEAGVVDGDVLERIDGVTILGASDFRTAPNADVSVVTVRRGDSMDEHPVRVATLTHGASSDLVATAVLLLVALALVALSATRRAGTLAWLGRVLSAPRGDAAVQDAAGERPPLFERMKRRASAQAERDPALAVMLCAAVGTVALAAPFGQAILAVDFDVIVAHLAGALATVLLGVAASAGRKDGRWVRALGRRLAVELVGVFPLAGVVALAGEIRLQSIAATQGGACWQWNLFHDPVLLALGATALVVVALQSDPVTDATAPRGVRGGLGVVLLARCAVLAALFFGGALLPGVTGAAQEATVALQMLGAAVFVMKTWALAIGVHVLGAALPRLHLARRRRFVWASLLPAVAVGVALVVGGVALARMLPPSRSDVLVTVVAWATFLVCGIVTGMRLWWSRAGVVRMTK